MRDESSDIALIGMAGLYPQAPDVGAFWQNILRGVDAITDPLDWPEEFRFEPDSNANDRVYTRRGGYLGDLARFDPTVFGVMPRAVDGGEPEHFVALRLAHEALIDAGYQERPFPRERTGVILGRGTYVNRGMIGALQHAVAVDQMLTLLQAVEPGRSAEDLERLRGLLKAQLPAFNAETAQSLAHSAMCGRIANRLDLMGPAYTVDAACASSLIAVGQAVKELREGSCDLVLAGGIQTSSSFPIALLFCQLGALSRTGRLRPFHPEADGTLLGEGAGVLVLKRLADAVRDGDRIYAVVKGVGIASDGRAMGVLTPRVEGEELSLRRAYAAAGVSPDTVGLVEAHGTGTVAGDSTEIEALHRVFAARGGVPSCALGSVKSMIGHSIPAAGSAGLIKAALALHHKILPPTLHAEAQPPQLANGPFYLNHRTRPWVHGGEAPRRAGVSAFGFGGINAHVVLEEWEPPAIARRARSAAPTPGPRDSELVVVWGASRDELLARVQKVEAALQQTAPPALADVAAALARGFDAESGWRLAVVAASVEEAARKLGHAARRIADPTCMRVKDRSGIFFFAEPLAREGTLAFLFPGEGAQYANMFAELAVHFPAVRACFDRMDRAAHRRGATAMPSAALFPPPGADDLAKRLWDMEGAVEVVFAADQAMQALLAELGIVAQAVVGHSSGEYAALLAAGAVAPIAEDDLVDKMHDMRRIGASAAERGFVVEAPLLAVSPTAPDQVPALLERAGGALHLAMDNCPHQVVIAGNEEAIAAAHRELRAGGAMCQRLPFARGYHTPLFAPFREEMRPFFDAIDFVSPAVPLYSCVTAAPMPADPVEVRRLALEQWATRVRFRETVEAMYADGVRIFVEVGPRGNLAAFVDDSLQKRPHLAVATNIEKRSALLQLHHAVGLLVAHGVPVRLAALHEGRATGTLDADALFADTPPAARRDRTMRLQTSLPVLRIGEAERALLGASRPAPVASDPAAPLRPAVVSGADPSAGPGPHPAAPPTMAALGATGASAVVSGRPTSGAPSPDAPPPAPPASAGAAPQRRPAPAGGAMAEYLRTMDDFLATQESVMRAFLGGRGAAATGVAPSGYPTTPAAMAPSVPQPAAGPTGGVPDAPAVRPSPAATSLPDEGASRVAPPAPVGASAVAGPAGSVAAAAPSTEGLDAAGLATMLTQLISEKTGYPPEMILPNLSLEADLGIDSIKRVEILGAFDERTGLIGDEMEDLTRLRTIDEIVAFFGPRLGGATRPEPADGGRAGDAGGAPAMAAPVRGWSLAGRVLRREGETAIVHLLASLDEHRFLLDHTLGGRMAADATLRALPVCPLAMTLEMMAAAAGTAAPGLLPVGLRGVRVFRWLPFVHGTLALEFLVRLRGTVAEVRVRTLDGTGAWDGEPPIVEGTVLLGDAYPAAPAAATLALEGEEPPRWAPDELYQEGQPHGMFHGPAFRAIASLDRLGANGAVATLQGVAPTRLLASDVAPVFALDPVILDAAGQVLGFWNAQRLDTSILIFPVGLGELSVYGPPLAPDAAATCRVRVEQLDDERIVATVEVADADGRLRLRVSGWEVKRSPLPESFYAFRLAPADRMMSVPIAGAGADAAGICVRFEVPEGFFESDGGIWREAMAHLVLGPTEREAWRALEGPVKRRNEWLMGRVAVKDAVRTLLRERYDVIVYPADIAVRNDAAGRPHVDGSWTATAGGAPCVSLGHADALAVALASPAGESGGVGIDVETVGRAGREFERVAFNATERAMLAALPEATHDEWALRCWCAKEAAVKAVGQGFDAGPRDAAVRRIDPATGDVDVELAGTLRRHHPGAIRASTLRAGDMIVAVAVIAADTDAAEAG